MTSIPFVIMAFVFAVSFLILIIGYIYKTRFPMSAMFFIVGASWLIVFLTTDAISVNDRIAEIDTLQEEIQIEDRSYLYRIDTFTGTSVDLRIGTEARVQQFGTGSTAIGSSFQCMELNVAKSGSPSVSQLVRFGVFVGNDPSAPMTEFGTLNVTDITTAFTLYEFCLPSEQHHVISLNDRIGARWNASADGNEILLRVDDTSNDVYESTNSRRQTWTTTWANANGEMTMRLYNTTTTVLSDNSIYTYEDNEYALRNIETLEPTFIGMLFLLFSISMLMVGVLIEWKND